MDDLLQALGLQRSAPEDNAMCYALYPPPGRGETGACGQEEGGGGEESAKNS